MRRFALAAALLATPLAAAPLAPAAGVELCRARLLVLSAFPGEIDRLLTSASVEGAVLADGRAFYAGRLAGNDVVLALTGIGLVNAERTTRTALETFACATTTAITGVVFSGVSGGAGLIGDVTVVERWTADGATWFPVDPEMYRVATAAAAGARLHRYATAGDPACAGVDPRAVRLVRMPHVPQIRFGGEGHSADPFGGRAWPCLPDGGDVFGCEPCRAPAHATPDPTGFARSILPFADPGFVLGYFSGPPAVVPGYEAEDMETAAVARVAAEHGLPFIAFRALSDGRGDPLRLPGFPFQFFVYRQLAADNAAEVSLAFLAAWAAR